MNALTSIEEFLPLSRVLIFHHTSCSVAQALLARDIMKRVEVDNSRNNRLPKSVSVGYTMVPGGAWIGRSFRLPFPTDKDFNSRVQKLVDGTRKVLSEKGHVGVIRIGFSAIDFVVRPKIGIDSFFGKGVNATLPATKHFVDGKGVEQTELRDRESFFSARKYQSASPKAKSNIEQKNQNTAVSAAESQQEMNGTTFHGNLQDGTTVSGTNTYSSIHVNNITDEEVARRLQDSLDEEMNEEANSKRSSRSDKVDKDEALALVLQSTYDREDALLSHMERFSSKRKNNDTTIQPQKRGNNNKRSKIDFFLKK